MMSHAQNGAITEISKCMADVLLFNESFDFLQSIPFGKPPKSSEIVEDAKEMR